MTAPTTREALLLQLAAIRGQEPPGGWFEIRCQRNAGMEQVWLPADDMAGAVDAIRSLTASRRTNLYIGAAVRRHKRGKLDSIARVWVLWADCDTRVSATRVGSHDPTFTIASGGTTDRVDNVHAWWALREPLTPGQAKRANRRLAYAIGSDINATDAARVLRPCGTLNFKYDPPRPVEMRHAGVELHFAANVVGRLADAPAREAPRFASELVDRGGDPLHAIPAAVYIEALTGRTVGADGKATCPFHAGGGERTPSLQAYGTDWACFGSCEPAPGRDHAGGTIIDFGARLYGIEPRGAGFHDIRRRLAADLLAGRVAA
jgi:hypothetical protein